MHRHGTPGNSLATAPPNDNSQPRAIARLRAAARELQAARSLVELVRAAGVAIAALSVLS